MAFVGKNPKFDSAVLKDNLTASVSNPPSGSSRILVRNGSLYVKDSSGNESVSGGGAGELNLINDTITASNWVASGAGITVATSSTASELPLSPVVDTGIKITPVSSTDYVRYRFTLPESLYSTSLKIAWYQEPLSGYTTGDLKLEMYTNSQSDYAGSYVELDLSTDSGGTTSIPNTKSVFVSTFTTSTVQYLELRIVRTSGTTGCVFQNVIVGPGSPSVFSEATDSVNGLVKKPRIQQKLLGSDVTAASTDVIAFNNLTIGRVYKLSYMLQIISTGASHAGLVNITDGTTTFTRVGCTSLASGENQHVGGSYYVTAATTVLKLRTISAWNNSTLAATSGGQQISWALIEEINDYSVTTDFT